jgi:hypothetical protein
LVVVVLVVAAAEVVVLFVTQEKSFDLGNADPRGSPMAVNIWLEICHLKLIS